MPLAQRAQPPLPLRHHGARSLLTRLSTCLHSTVLSLRGNELGPEGGAALAEGLKGNSLLQLLELAGPSRTKAFAFMSAPPLTRLHYSPPKPTLAVSSTTRSVPKEEPRLQRA